MERNSRHVLDLRTNDPGKALRLRDFVRLSDGAGYYCTVEFSIVPFSGTVHEFYMDAGHFEEFLAGAARIDSELSGSVELSFGGEPGRIAFSADPRGQVFVDCEFETFACGRTQRVSCGFQTDQTILKALIGDLKVVYGDLGIG